MSRPLGRILASVLALLLCGCTVGDSEKGSTARHDPVPAVGDPEKDPPPASTVSPDPVPELERVWEVGSKGTIPQSWNERYWLTDWSYTAGTSSGTSFSSTGLKMFDGQSGKRIDLDLGGSACGVPALRPGQTHFVVQVSDQAPSSFQFKEFAGPPQTPQPRDCSGLAVFDATTGRKVWERPVGASPPLRYWRSTLDAVILENPNGGDRCFSNTEKVRLSLNNDKCWSDLPTVPPPLDEYGGALKRHHERELGRFDGVVLVGSDDLSVSSPLVRAIDATTGMTLWADRADPDPSDYPSWRRTETYAASPDSLLRIHYEFEEGDAPGEFLPTFAVISRVDPRTGEELGPVGKVAGGLFLAQVGDMTVMGVDQEEGFDAHLAGFRIPPPAE